MTYHYNNYYTTYEFTAFSEYQLASQSGFGMNLGPGDSFEMPAYADTCIEVTDNDRYLSGDRYEHATDHYGQQASITKDGAHVGNGGQIYAECYFWVYDQHGNWYLLIEIEQEGASGDYFTFHTGYGMPPAGADLTVHSKCNVTSDWIDFTCLDAGPKTEPLGSVGGRLFVDADGDNTEWNTETNAWEEGVDGATVELINAQGNVVATTTTDHYGTYKFNDVVPGDYTIKFYKPDGTEFVQKDVGGAGEDSDADANGVTGTFTIDPGEHQWNIDAGIRTDPATGGECIVIEAEDMHEYGYRTVSGDQASGGKLVKLDCAGGTGKLWTYFKGESGTYDLKIHAQDESDGQSTIKVLVNGHVVDTVKLDRDSDGKGSNNGGFSEFVIEDIQIDHGDKVKLIAYGDHGEYVRIDKIELCKDGEKCPEGFTLEDFSALGEGTIVADQIDGVTISAQRAGDGAGSPNDAMIFDSANPTGGDHDLGYANQGSILIISEDGDSSDPDDNAGGGVITFDFDNPSDLSSIKLLDIEESGGSIKLFDTDGNVISTVAIPAAGNNSIQTVDLDATGVAKMEIHLVGSGAVDDLCWKPGEAPEPGSLSGRYFLDENGNGLDDDGMNGVAGVTVELLDAAGTPTGITTTTGTDGSYSFTGLEPGTYGVKFTDTVTGLPLTAQDVGGDDTIDSDAADLGGGMSQITGIVVNAGADTPDNDAGVADPGTAALGDTVFLDADGDGIQDAGEGGVANVTVTLTGAGDDGVFGTADDTTATQTTDGNGTYLFENLEAGDYKVTFSDTPAGTAFTVQDQGGDDAADSDVDAAGMTGTITLGAGETDLTVDAGIVELPGSLSGKYFLDADRDGLDNDGDNGIGGITVELLDAAGTPTGITTTTGADGTYSFTGLPPGTYGVKFTDPDTGRELTTRDVDGNVSDDIDSDAVDLGGGMSEITGITVVAGADTPDNDAGVVTKLASLGDVVFEDLDADGIQDAGEAGIAGATVNLLADLDGDGAIDDVLATATTDATGFYAFTDLEPDDYRVEFIKPAGFDAASPANQGGDDTVDSDGVAEAGAFRTGTITLDPGEDDPTNDMGFYKLAELGDFVWDDLDGDGIQDESEPGVDGVTVELKDASGTVIASTTTANGGAYSFTGLTPGTYSVLFIAPTGFGFTQANAGPDDRDSDADPATGMTQEVTLTSGEVNGTVDAGLVELNTPPEPQPDTAKFCADAEEAKRTIDVVANDSDDDGDDLTVTAVDGNAIAPGGSIVIDGVTITLSADGDSLIFDGEARYAGLNVGEEAVVEYAYTVSDGIDEASSTVEVTYCGVAETLADICAALPSTVTLQVRDENDPAGTSDAAFTVLLSGSNSDGAINLDGLYEQGYCLAAFEPFDVAAPPQDVVDAPSYTADVYCTADSLPAGVLQTVGINGETAQENLDLINWILNEEFHLAENGGYSDGEIQGAIWALTDGQQIGGDGIFIAPGGGDVADAQAILDLALEDLDGDGQADNEGFTPGNGDIVGVIIDPTDPKFEQPFIVGLEFDDIDCLC